MSNKERLYCICRSSDIERFMIMCDECEEWFHGDCIRISEKEAKHIKYFYCKSCRIKKPFLKVKYRKSKKKDEREREKLDFKRPSKEKRKLEKKLKRKRSDVHKSASAPILTETSSKMRKYENDEAWEPVSLSVRHLSVSDKKQHASIKIYSSGDDDDDISSKPAEKPEMEKSSEYLKEERVKNEVSPPVEHVKDNNRNKDPNAMETSQNIEKHPLLPEKSKERKRCGKCENCLRKENCGLCDVCFDREKYGTASKLQKCRLRRCLNKKSKKSKLKTKHSLKRKADAGLSTERTGGRGMEENYFSKHARSVEYELTPRDLVQSMLAAQHEETKQCYGPGCAKVAATSSKYCSDACGRNLARNRMYQILPQRIQEWNSTPTVANDSGRMELERIRARMVQAKSELKALENKFQKREAIILTGKSFMVDKKQNEAEEEGEGDNDHSIYCVVCGHSVTFKTAIKHMDKCYIKIESQMSFGSVYPTNIEGSKRLFCDVYNDQQQTYCKRLQVLCPEHMKEPKVTDDDVCGCPLNCDIDGPNPPSMQSQFCRMSKRKCSKHFKWETMYRAEVDLQRIRQWLKIDEIFDEERKIKTAMANRAGLVSLLLHQTTVHDPHCVDMRTKPSVSKKPAYRLLI